MLWYEELKNESHDIIFAPTNGQVPSSPSLKLNYVSLPRDSSILLWRVGLKKVKNQKDLFSFAPRERARVGPRLSWVYGRMHWESWSKSLFPGGGNKVSARTCLNWGDWGIHSLKRPQRARVSQAPNQVRKRVELPQWNKKKQVLGGGDVIQG